MTRRWLFSTIGKRGYLADYLREESVEEVFIVGTGNARFTAGFASCEQALIVPGYRSAGYQQVVQAGIQDHAIQSVLTLADQDSYVLSAMRPDLERQGVDCFFPDLPAAEVAFDKWRTHEWATSEGFLTPRTYLDIHDAVRDLSWPIVAKPRKGSASAGFALMPNSAALHALDPAVEYVFQEHIPGAEFNVEVLGDLSGRPVRACAWRKHASPAGETALAITVNDDRLIQFGRHAAQRLPLIGPADFDLMVWDGEVYLIEVNARFGGGYPVSHMAGAGFMKAMSQIAVGGTLGFEAHYSDGVFMMKRLVPFGGSIDAAPSIFGWPIAQRTTQ